MTQTGIEFDLENNPPPRHAIPKILNLETPRKLIYIALPQSRLLAFPISRFVIGRGKAGCKGKPYST